LYFTNSLILFYIEHLIAHSIDYIAGFAQ